MMYQMREPGNAERRLDDEADQTNEVTASDYYYDDTTGYELYREADDDDSFPSEELTPAPDEPCSDV